MTHEHAPFSDPTTVASYAENARRNVPGLADLHRMVMLLLAEQARDGAHILVVGAGGGMDAHSDASGRLFRQHPVSHSGVSGQLRIFAA